MKNKILFLNSKMSYIKNITSEEYDKTKNNLERLYGKILTSNDVEFIMIYFNNNNRYPTVEELYDYWNNYEEPKIIIKYPDLKRKRQKYQKAKTPFLYQGKVPTPNQYFNTGGKSKKRSVKRSVRKSSKKRRKSRSRQRSRH